MPRSRSWRSPRKYCKMEYKIYSPHFFLLFSSFSKKNKQTKRSEIVKLVKLIGSFHFIFFDCFVFFHLFSICSTLLCYWIRCVTCLVHSQYIQVVRYTLAWMYGIDKKEKEPSNSHTQKGKK
jgi:hypothetical protein